MHIAWEHFTPISSLSGGLLIGLAAVILFAGIGRIAGVTGILAGILNSLFAAQKNDFLWRFAFIVGLGLSPIIYAGFNELPAIQLEASWPSILISGLCVGLGTRIGSGCTSGHGVCGISRLSGRSMIATISFMGAGFATVYLIRHWL
ncbi:YeeE/YedE family protein [Undibacterium fentianense]|uniref:YeeE/YedE family protein n=1 Tax=Undibacterium fentianense TaxID=2828728 RepID=A0A941E5I9_9BURK|nr:YeeE/YedE thiosulfate transporter family protein [Undibacterium fentianense]MBR7801341.1 YeeE/YedE family protein [Undibacterium fentianense]